MPRYTRRQMYGLLWVAIGILLFCGSFLFKARRLVLVAGFAIVIGVVMFARRHD